MKFEKPRSRPVLSVDIGKKRLGLAYCDALLITVSILPAVNRTKECDEFKIINHHIRSHNIEGLVMGLPLDDNGNMTFQANDCMKYGEILSKKFRLPFAFVNEHSSTWESLHRFGVKNNKTGLVDSLSAKIILEQWIKEGPELKEYVFNKHIKY